jgi:hypothetical protein
MVMRNKLREHWPMIDIYTPIEIESDDEFETVDPLADSDVFIFVDTNSLEASIYSRITDFNRKNAGKLLKSYLQTVELP